MKSKEILKSHYNARYPLKERQENTAAKILVNKYPRDRYQSAAYWGKGSGRVLEIGAGSGEVLSFLKDYYDEYVATELSEERIKYLREIFGEDDKIKIIQNDIEDKNLDFSAGYFDTIIMVAVIEHLIDPISVVQYCYSLLKPGGKLLIDTPNAAKWTRRLKLLFGFFPSTGSKDEGFISYDGKQTDLHDNGHLHYFTFRALKKILVERVGFSAIEYCGHGKTILSRVFPGLFSECFVTGIK